jgi:hypothetical protein
MKALIFNNIVVDVAEKEFPVASSLTWTDCSSDVKIGFSFDGSTFTDVEAERIANMTYADKRKLEYPSVQDLVVALYDTDDKAAIDEKRAEIKLKYPKPQ